MLTPPKKYGFRSTNKIFLKINNSKIYAYSHSIYGLFHRLKEYSKVCMWRRIKRFCRRKVMANNGDVSIPLLVNIQCITRSINPEV